MRGNREEIGGGRAGGGGTRVRGREVPESNEVLFTTAGPGEWDRRVPSLQRLLQQQPPPRACYCDPRLMTRAQGTGTVTQDLRLGAPGDGTMTQGL